MEEEIIDSILSGNCGGFNVDWYDIHQADFVECDGTCNYMRPISSINACSNGCDTFYCIKCWEETNSSTYLIEERDDILWKYRYRYCSKSCLKESFSYIKGLDPNVFRLVEFVAIDSVGGVDSLTRYYAIPRGFDAPWIDWAVYRKLIKVKSLFNF